MANPFRRIDWRVFGVLWAAGLLGVAAILPYMMDLVRSLPADLRGPDLPMSAVAALGLVQNGIVLAVALVIALNVSERVGLRMPLIRAWATGAERPDARPIALPGVIVGATVGGLLVAFEVALFLRHLPAPMLPLFDFPLWKRLLSGVVYGGITEELFMRLFLLSLAAWLFGKIWKAPDGRPSATAFWAAIVLVAVLFGLGHLPITARLTPLTPWLVARALTLNGIAGLAFGYLYWQYGLEAAMVAHMSAHLVMQIPGVMMLKAML